MISCSDKYVQIKLFQDTKILSKVLLYANKHFSKHYRLSSSILILDDGEIIKKNYLINWCYHALSYDIDFSERTSEESLEYALQHSHLPIRIKIVKPTEMLEKIKVKVEMLGSSRVILTLSKKSKVAERYIKGIFATHYIGMSGNEIYLQSNSEHFWEKVVDFLGNKVIHNVALSFEYNSFNANEFSFLTAEEKALRQCYVTLDSQFGDDFELVKKRYLKLAKEYHPDNFYGVDESKIINHIIRFRQINEAYKKIKLKAQY